MALYTLYVQYAGRPPETKSFDKEHIIIGRDVGDIALLDPQVSGRHAEMRFNAGKLVFQDLGSTNGSFLPNGQRVQAPVELGIGQAVRLGQSVLTVQHIDFPGAVATSKTMFAGAGSAPPAPGGFSAPQAPPVPGAAAPLRMPQPHPSPQAPQPGAASPPLPGGGLPQPGRPAGPPPGPPQGGYSPSQQQGGPPPGPPQGGGYPPSQPQGGPPPGPPQGGGYPPSQPHGGPPPGPPQAGGGYPPNQPQGGPPPGPPQGYPPNQPQAGPPLGPPQGYPPEQPYSGPPSGPPPGAPPPGMPGAPPQALAGPPPGAPPRPVNEGLQHLSTTGQPSGEGFIADIQRGWALLSPHLVQAALILFFVQAIPAVLNWPGAAFGWGWWTFLMIPINLIAGAASVVGGGAVFYFMARAHYEQPVTWLDAWKASLGRGAGSLISLAVAGLIGAIALGIPLGFFVGAIWLFEDKKFFDVNLRNLDLFKLEVGRTILVALALGFGFGVIFGVATAVFGFLTFLGIGALLSGLLMAGLVSVLVPLFAGISIQMYLELRKRLEQGDVDEQCKARLEQIAQGAAEIPGVPDSLGQIGQPGQFGGGAAPGQPGYPGQAQPGYPPQGQHPGQPQPGYQQPPQAQPPQPGYPPQGQPAYPPQGQPAYPPQGQPAYPPQGQPAYPPQGQPAYPPQGHPPQPGYPQPGQQHQPGPPPGYPPSPPGGYPPGGGGQQ